MATAWLKHYQEAVEEADGYPGLYPRAEECVAFEELQAVQSPWVVRPESDCFLEFDHSEIKLALPVFSDPAIAALSLAAGLNKSRPLTVKSGDSIAGVSEFYSRKRIYTFEPDEHAKIPYMPPRPLLRFSDQWVGVMQSALLSFDADAPSRSLGLQTVSAVFPSSWFRLPVIEEGFPRKTWPVGFYPHLLDRIVCKIDGEEVPLIQFTLPISRYIDFSYCPYRDEYTVTPNADRISGGIFLLLPSLDMPVSGVLRTLLSGAKTQFNVRLCLSSTREDRTHTVSTPYATHYFKQGVHRLLELTLPNCRFHSVGVDLPEGGSMQEVSISYAASDIVVSDEQTVVTHSHFQRKPGASDE